MIKHLFTIGILTIFAFILMSPAPVVAQNSCREGDTNHDGKITLADFETWRRIFKGGSVTGSPSQAPTQPPQSGTVTYGTDGNGSPTTGGCTVNVAAGQQINQAIGSAASGAVICVAASTRTSETITLNKANVTVRATGKVSVKNAVVTGTGATLDGFTVVGGTALRNPTYGIEINGSDIKVINNLVNGTDLMFGIRCDRAGCNNALIADNTVTRIESIGIFVGGGDKALIRNNNVFDLYADHVLEDDVDGMRFFGTNHVFRNNYIHDINERKTNAGSGGEPPHVDCFQNYQQSGITTSNVTFEHNYCIRITRQCLIASNHVRDAYETKNLIFRGNVCDIFDHQAINLKGVPDSIFEDNLFIGGYTQIFAFGPGFGSTVSSNNTVRRNIYLRANSKSTIFYNNQVGSTKVENNIDKLMTELFPRREAFLNRLEAFPARTESDFTESKAWVQALGAELNKPLGQGVNVDIDGKPRPQGSVREVGPFEFPQ